MAVYIRNKSLTIRTHNSSLSIYFLAFLHNLFITKCIEVWRKFSVNIAVNGDEGLKTL